MGFKNFRVNIIVRILFLFLVMLAFVYTLSRDQWYMTLTGLFLIGIALIIELINYVERTNRKHISFLEQLKTMIFQPTFL